MIPRDRTRDHNVASKGVPRKKTSAVQSGQPSQIEISRSETSSGLSNLRVHEDITHGIDAVVRSAELKTTTGNLVRPVVKLASVLPSPILPISRSVQLFFAFVFSCNCTYYEQNVTCTSKNHVNHFQEM